MAETTVVIENHVTAVDVIEVAGIQGPPGPPGQPGSGPGGAPLISADAFNRAASGSDGGVYVPNRLATDPLAYYLLAKG